MKNHSRRFAVYILTTFLLVGGVAFAASASSYMEAKQKELASLIRKPKSAQSDKQLRSVFDGLLDYQRLARDSLGKQWADRSADEQKEFEALLTQLVQAAYTKNIRNTLDYQVTVQGSEQAKEGELVKTVAKHKSNKRKEPIHVHYLVHRVGGKWRVYDIITEGSSLVRNYRSQFRRIIRKKGFSELLSRMRKKAKES